MNLSNMLHLETDEIITVLTKASLFGGVIHQLGSLELVTCSIHKIEIANSKIIMKVLVKKPLDPALPICINLAYRNFTFRVGAGQYLAEEDCIVCEIPQAARAIEERSGGERHVLPFDEMARAMVNRIEKRDSIGTFEVKIADVSKTGLGIYIMDKEEVGLRRYDHLWIREIDQQKLENPIFGRVEYVNIRKYKDSVTVMRAGISVEKKLPEEVFIDLVRRCRLVLTA